MPQPSPNRYFRVSEDEHVFVFKFDPSDPEQLHITVRHLTTVDDALDAFFDPDGKTRWNKRHKRFETYTASHTLYWYWIDEAGKVVMIVSCISETGGSYTTGGTP